MSKHNRDGKAAYKVVVNREERYSIWPAHRENARGWRDAGKSGTEKECLAYIEKVSQDARPPAGKKQK
ncbi:MAG TPA: MbtH family protein [Pyrinomonadaceae bacterium]|nr:MbtH family protein [Pyrinomonadaceae bacterium]